MAVLAQDLRDAVLQAAISGKLTEQLDSDSSVEELLSKIKAEKEQLIKDRKIKKEKALSEIAEEDVPFEIPNNWKWCYLSSIAKSINAGGDKPNDFSKEKTSTCIYPVFSNGEINDGLFGFTSENRVTEKALTISGRGTIGFTRVREANFTPIVRLLVITLIENTINFDYLSCVLNQLMESGIGSAVKQLTVPMIINKLIPIPPIEEQARIVAKVEEIMSKIDEYEKIEKQLEDIKKAFPMDMRDALLQAAMQGKLTEQLDTDSSVDDLIEQIKAERQKLEAEGKVKKSKGKKKGQQNDYFVELAEDEQPFEIPITWKMCKLENILTLDKGEKLSGIKYNYLEAKYLRTLSNPTIKDSGEFVKKGTYTILVDGENSGEVFKIPEDGYMGSTYKVLNMTSELNIEFILYFLNYHRRYLRDNKKGSAIPHLNKTIFYDLAFPLPPLEAQKRIVKVLNDLLPLCEAL